MGFLRSRLGLLRGPRRVVGGTPTPTPNPFARTMPDMTLAVLVDGDSNSNGMVVSYPAGNPDDTIYERKPSMTSPAGTMQIVGPDGTVAGLTPGTIRNNIVPVWGQSGSTTEDRVSLAECLARQLKARVPANVSVAVISMGRGGASVMAAGTNTVSTTGIGVGGLYFENYISAGNSGLSTLKAIQETQIAFTAQALPSNDGNRVAAPTIDPTAMTAALTDRVSNIRSRFPEASEVAAPFMGIMPGMSGASATAVRTALLATAAAVGKSQVFIPAGSGANDNLHPVPLDLEQVASDMCDWWLVQPMPQKVLAFSIAQANNALASTVITSASTMVRLSPGVAGTLSSTYETAVAPVDDPTNFGAFSTSPKTVYLGDRFKVRRSSSAVGGASAAAPVTVTGPVDSYTADFVIVTEGGSTSFIMGGSTSVVITNGKTVAVPTPVYQEA